MSERDELAQIIDDRWHGYGYNPQGAAEAILAAGYRKPQTVTTPSELMSLPVGSVVLSETYGTPKRPSALQKTPGALWIPIGRAGDTHSRWILPATVLHVGGVSSE